MIERYWFLFGLALVWLLFATVYDLKKREVPNWLNFSFIAFALAYRAFYSAYFYNWMFLVFGLLGFLGFFVLGNIFYYARLFGGGDAKLLMGLGIILPFEKWGDFAFGGLGFVMVFFLVGALYSLIYSVFLAFVNQARFGKEFEKNLGNRRYWTIIPAVLAILLALFYVLAIPFSLWVISLIVSVLFFFLFIYLKAVDSCMVRLVSPGKLTEGDWIVEDIQLNGSVVRKTVHGLSLSDIAKLRKAKRRVLVKEGVPFVPAIFIAFLMVFFSAVSGSDFQTILFSLLS